MSEKEFNKISNSKDVKKNIEDALKKEYSDGIKNVKYTYLTREDSTLDINTVVTDSEGTKYKNEINEIKKKAKRGKAKSKKFLSNPPKGFIAEQITGKRDTDPGDSNNPGSVSDTDLTSQYSLHTATKAKHSFLGEPDIDNFP